MTDPDALPALALHRRTLACGLDVVVHPVPESPVVATSITYRAGSSDERPERTGLAHLFEHLFKASVARTGGHHYDVLKQRGATDANASTGADRTSYHETVPANDLALALWLESTRLAYFLPDLDADRLATQQQVVRAERRQRYENVPYGAERFAIAAALYPEGHPARHLTIGRHADIAAATLDDLAAWYRTWYVPANATLVICGDVELAEADALVDRYFTFPGVTSTRPPRPTPIAPPLAAPHAEVIEDRFAALARLHLVWPTSPAYAPDEPALDVLAAQWAAIGTGALWRRLVYEQPLAQRVQCYHATTRLTGELHVIVDLRTGVDPARARDVVDAELAALATTSDAELAAAIARVVTRREAGAVWSLARVEGRASALQHFALYTGVPDGFAAERARYRAVDPATLRGALRTLAGPRVDVVTRPASAA